MPKYHIYLSEPVEKAPSGRPPIIHVRRGVVTMHEHLHVKKE